MPFGMSIVADEVSSGAFGAKGLVIGSQVVGSWDQEKGHDVWSFRPDFHWPDDFVLSQTAPPSTLETNGVYRIPSGGLTLHQGTPPSHSGRCYHLTNGVQLDANLVITYQPGNWSQPERMIWYSRTRAGLMSTSDGYLIDLSHGPIRFKGIPGFDPSSWTSAYLLDERYA